MVSHTIVYVERLLVSVSVNPAKPFKKITQSKKYIQENVVYTHCDPHHILYPSASSRPQQQNYKPAVEKFKWKQFSCPYLW